MPTDAQKVIWSMLAYAATHSPYYREQRWAKTARRGVAVDVKNIPITPKSAVRSMTHQFYVADVPASEGRVSSESTSGSTGTPMAVRHTRRFHDINVAEHGRLAAGWGLGNHARAVMLHNPKTDRPRGTIRERKENNTTVYELFTVDVVEAFHFIAKMGATLLHARPQSALGILQYGEEIGVPLPVKLLSTVSEVVPEQLRGLVDRLSGCRWIDKYATVETGTVAVRCADCGAYHPADRHAVIEILDDGDRPAKVGKMGRVIVTPLYNAAMPLIRYETGDYALVSRVNNCTRSAVALERIVGRERNLFKLPNGRRVMPWVDPRAVSSAGVRQFKLMQISPTDIDFLYIPKDPEGELTNEQAQQLIDTFMAPGFNVKCQKTVELPVSASGKYMMHECLA